MNLTEGNLKKKIVLLALPIALSGWLQLLYSAADILTCALYVSEDSIGAIAATGSLISLIINLFIELAVGANSVMGRAYGAQDKEKGERVIGTTYWMALIVSLILSLVGITCSRFFLTMMKTDESIIDLSDAYMRIYFMGTPFMVITNFGSALLRGMGDTKRPSIYLTIAGLLNVGLDFLFVIVFRLGVSGVAITTVISEAVSSLLITLTLMKFSSFASLRWSAFRIYKKEAEEIIHIGLPAGIQSVMYSIPNVIIQKQMNIIGKYVDIGSGAAGEIEPFINVALDAFAQATLVFVSANYGAKKVDNIKFSIKWGLIFSCLASLIAALPALLLARQLVGIFIKDNQEAYQIGLTQLYIDCPSYVIFAVLACMSSALRGMGYSILPMGISLLGICGFRILYIYTFYQLPELNGKFLYLFLAYPFSWILTALGDSICYLCVRKKAYEDCLSGEEEDRFSSNGMKLTVTDAYFE